ncbi:MAG: hypothetical protein M3O15_05260, partial [Acidobacteriota bacterium]|nr:hypothetical protein [Acidobacteriota bacterium]
AVAATATGRTGFVATQVPPGGRSLLAGATGDGRVILVPVKYDVTFEGDRRVTKPNVGAAVTLEIDPRHRPASCFAARLDDNGNATAAAQLADGTLTVVHQGTEQNLLTGESTASIATHQTRPSSPVTTLVMDAEQKNLYGGTQDGKLLWWPLADGVPGQVSETSTGGSPVTALTLLIGGRSLVVGQADGVISVWFPVRQADNTFRMIRIRDFPPLPG